MLIKNVIKIATFSLFLLGCETLFLQPSRVETKPVKVSGTTYQTYMLVLSHDTGYDSPLDDPKAQREVYAVAGPGVNIHCGSSLSGCDPAIRKFNRSDPVSGGM